MTGAFHAEAEGGRFQILRQLRNVQIARDVPIGRACAGKVG